MNLTSGNTISTTWRRVRFQHIAGVAGIGLAVSAFVAIGGLGANDSARPAAPSRDAGDDGSALRLSPGGERKVAATGGHEAIFYVVDTLAEASELEGAAAQAFAELGAHAPVFTHTSRGVLLVASHEAEAALENLRTFGALELAEQGVDLNLTDLR